MAIIDQFANCKYNENCFLVRSYDNTSCSSYSKRINLDKERESVPASSLPTALSEVSSSVETATNYDFEVDKRSFWQKLFSFNGRNNRSTYWLISIFTNFLFLPANIAGDDMGMGVALFTLLIFIPAIWILLATLTKRFHDLGHSGWYALLLLIPLLNVIIGIWVAFWPGDHDSNEYGPVP